MNTPHDNTTHRSLREWWADPPRSGMQRMINPWEYKRLRFVGTTRVVGGLVAAFAGVMCLSYSAYGWAAFFLAIGALNLAGGSWFLSIENSKTAARHP